jgi:hypothetical protein
MVQHSGTKIIFLTFVYWVTFKCGVKHVRIFNKLAIGRFVEHLRRTYSTTKSNISIFKLSHT